ncbi:hypothetical protein L9F63_000532 [Diploptera punctata]|uniref:Nucleolar protein 8 n=1 Tax=Diploptera punctata TaxID=6984 RepID=A0AAD8ALF2_DIPPU|nr:hypothetical protein L9F63_000532 [Diploptera punctata]
MLRPLPSDSGRNNRKVVFDDDEEIEEKKTAEVQLVSDGKGAKKTVLFGDSSGDDTDDDTTFRIKSQFEGSEGKKLLELQSRYGNDKRFTLDEKFYESGDDSEEGDNKLASSSVDDERNQQLAILQNVLGHQIPFSEEKKVPKSHRMLRFDPSKQEHTVFEKEKTLKKKISCDEETEEPSSVLETKSKIKNKKDEKVVENVTSVPVSKEKFYKVTDSLKTCLQKKDEENTFSLRQLFGRSDRDGEEEKRDTYIENKLKKHKQTGWVSNPFKYDSSDDDDEEEEAINKEDKMEVSQDEKLQDSKPTHFGENLFFMTNDPRLQEGLDFLKKKPDEEGKSHEFAKHRRELKHLVRLKVKNNVRNFNKYKKKIGIKKRKLLRRNK